MNNKLIQVLLLGVAASAMFLSGCPDLKGSCMSACEPKDQAIDECAKHAPRETCEKSMKDPKKIADCKAMCEKSY